MNKVTLSEDEVKKCYAFAEESWDKGSQSPKNFGKEIRTKNQFLADQIEGKLSECVLKKSLQELGMSIELDFNLYDGEHNTDNGDILLINNSPLNVRIDAKGSSAYAQWLLVEQYKFYNEDMKTHKSDAFVMVCFDENFPQNKLLRENPKIIIKNSYEGLIKGWAKVEDFYEPSAKELWFQWPQKSSPWNTKLLPSQPPYSRKGLEKYLDISVPDYEAHGKKTKLSVSLNAEMNYGLPLKWLRKDWEEFKCFLK